MKRSILACALMAMSACQSYSSVSLASVPVGADIEVALTDSGSRYVTQFIGSRAEALQGTARLADSSEVTMIVNQITRSGGATELGEGKLVQIPSALVSSVKRQTTSVSRSVLLGGAVLAGSILAGRSLGVGSGSAKRGTGTVTAGQ